MNKKLIAVLVFTGFCLLLNGQEYFNKRFTFSFPTYGDGALNVMEIEDGYIINGGTSDLYISGWPRLGMAKMNLKGEIQWQKNWGDTLSELYYADRNSLIRVSDEYYSLGSKNTYLEDDKHVEMVMMKYNSDLDTLWTAYYGEKVLPYDTAYIPRSFSKVEDGFIVIGANFPDDGITSNIILLKTDTLGKVNWERNIGENGFNYLGYSVFQTPDNGYAIGGYKFVFTNTGAVGDPIVIKTDSVGNFEWEVSLGGPYHDGTAVLCQGDDGDILAISRYDTDSLYYNLYLSRVQVSRISNQGEVLSSRLYGDASRYLDVANCRNVADDGIIISGSCWSTYPKVGFLLRLDNEGDSLWYREYSILTGKDSQSYFYDVIPTTDKGFLAVGGCFPVPPDTGNQDAWAIKLDSLGCEGPWECWVGEHEENETMATYEAKVFPNPATGYFVVKSALFEKEDCLLEVISLQGKKIFTMNVKKGESEIYVGTREWATGLYVVRIVGREGIVSRKVAVHR
jgi:hypothetical protein